MLGLIFLASAAHAELLVWISDAAFGTNWDSACRALYRNGDRLFGVPLMCTDSSNVRNVIGNQSIVTPLPGTANIYVGNGSTMVSGGAGALLENPIRRLDGSLLSSTRIFTGCSELGEAGISADCTVGQTYGRVGTSGDLTSYWLDDEAGSALCAGGYRVYCYLPPSLAPTTKTPTTPAPTMVPTTQSPTTTSPTTSSPTTSPTTTSPTTSPTTIAPTSSPTTDTPTASPTTAEPTRGPTTLTPTTTAPSPAAPQQEVNHASSLAALSTATAVAMCAALFFAIA